MSKKKVIWNCCCLFSVIDTPSGTNEKYKADMINMLDEIVCENY
jgi:hypothetical protein